MTFWSVLDLTLWAIKQEPLFLFKPETVLTAVQSQWTTGTFLKSHTPWCVASELYRYSGCCDDEANKDHKLTNHA